MVSFDKPYPGQPTKLCRPLLRNYHGLLVEPLEDGAVYHWLTFFHDGWGGDDGREYSFQGTIEEALAEIRRRVRGLGGEANATVTNHPTEECGAMEIDWDTAALGLDRRNGSIEIMGRTPLDTRCDVCYVFDAEAVVADD